ncbi:MAG: exodeoxyribonuclease VII large subunit [Thermodesulfobacteriota bacterium]
MLTETFPRTVLTISELTRNIKEVIERSFPLLWVSGEVSNLRIPSSGHLYFTLKDEASQIRVVMFRSQQRKLKFVPEDGVEVIAQGTVTVYEKRGEYQLLCDYLEPKGKGALQLAFEQLKARLASKGWFDEARKRPLPLFPARIGLVTSATGAAVRDILTVIDSRFPGTSILLYPVQVQGDYAPGEIVEALNYLGRLSDIDVIILARGGGSIEDLWAFNEEEVACAIYSCPVPVVSAVGHETDFTIADFVADVRAPTPTGACLVVVQNKADLEDRVAYLIRRLAQSMGRLVEMRRTELASVRAGMPDPLNRIWPLTQRLDELGLRLNTALRFSIKERTAEMGRFRERLLLSSPSTRLSQGISCLEDHIQSLKQAVHFHLAVVKKDLERYLSLLNSVSPLAVLGRGYSIVLSWPEQKMVTDAAGLSIGQELRAKFYRGSAHCQVTQVNVNNSQKEDD